MDPQGQQLHFILFPLMAQGHQIPTFDMARLLAQRGVLVTIVTTPSNALRFKRTIKRAVESNLPIRLLELRFPSAEVGLPEGCENADALPTPEAGKDFFVAITLLQQPLEHALGEMEPKPSCLISDFCMPWTNETARKFDIPRVIFHGMSSFALLCSHNILHYKAMESVSSDSKPFVIPALPDCIEITKSRLPGSSSKEMPKVIKDLRDKVNESDLSAYGVVINSFYELEPMYIKEYQKAKSNKAWCIGPVSSYNKGVLDKFERGNEASIDEHECLNWLDTKQPNSVVYACLGSLCRLIPDQIKEIGLGLEASKCSFIWVMRSGARYDELEKWLTEEGFVERTKDRGLVIRGWAPQVLILSHQAIGGFITHCGWNSTLEGICAGVPMITWPMFAEQFLNEKLIVQVLGIGVEIGVSDPVPWGEEDDFGVLVKAEDIQRAVNKVMHEKDGEERRQKGRELARMARKAVEEGGSSYLSMTLFIEDIKHQASMKTFIYEQNTPCQKQNHVEDNCH